MVVDALDCGALPALEELSVDWTPASAAWKAAVYSQVKAGRKSCSPEAGGYRGARAAWRGPTRTPRLQITWNGVE